MLYVKQNPIGVDIPIQKLQERLFGGLCKAWGLSDSEYNSFGRVYRNQRDGGYIPETYMGGKEYSETFLDDRVPVTSFFAVGDTVNADNGGMTVNAAVIFCVDLAQIKPDIKHRADEETHFDVFERCNFFVQSADAIVTGVDNVFREFTALRTKFRDMHPYHCFRINLTVAYRKC